MSEHFTYMPIFDGARFDAWKTTPPDEGCSGCGATDGLHGPMCRHRDEERDEELDEQDDLDFQNIPWGD